MCKDAATHALLADLTAISSSSVHLSFLTGGVDNGVGTGGALGLNGAREADDLALTGSKPPGGTFELAGESALLVPAPIALPGGAGPRP